MSAIAQPLTIARIALALSQAEYPLPHELYPELPRIEDWLCLQDGLLLRVHGRIHEAAAPARPRLSAAVIAVETAPGRIIRCVDGDYRLGHPQQIESARRGYEEWWQALGWVREGLITGGMLREFEVTAAMPKIRPWA
jgi:hypothetical protein